jgi:carbon starvation protein
VNAFVSGAALFVSQLGLPLEASKAFVALVVVSFALTSLDSATRLLRYNVTEISETLGLKWLGGRYVASLVAVAAIGFFCFFKLDGKPAGLALWAVFGTTNQLLASLILLAISLYLLQRGRNAWYTLIPMAFMLLNTLWAMTVNIQEFYAKDATALLVVCGLLFVVAIWLMIESALAIRRYRRGEITDDLNIIFPEDRTDGAT